MFPSIVTASLPDIRKLYEEPHRCIEPESNCRRHAEVSWMITGIRHDAWAKQNRMPNAAEKSKLLHPEAFGRPTESGIYTATPSNAAAPHAN